MSSKSLTTDPSGRVENLEFKPGRHVYWPLFEAISNALDAIHSTERTDGRIVIEIIRDQPPLATLEELQNRNEFPISDLIIQDNGIGFDDENYTSFQTLDSRHKREWGGKGIGRLYWLKTFDHVEVDSIYMEGKIQRSRKFKFDLKNQFTPLTDTSMLREPGTRLRLTGYKKKYESYLRSKKLSTIKTDIIKHFLATLMVSPWESIALHDGPDTEIIRKEDLPKAEKVDFKIDEHLFELHHMRVPSVPEPGHFVYYCADNRVVDDECIDKKIGLTKKAKLAGTGDEEPFFYVGYVIAPFLNETVNSDRTGFQIDEKQHSIEGLAITFDQIRSAVYDAARNFLNKDLQALEDSKNQRLEGIFSDGLAAFSYMKTQNKSELASIAVDASEEDMREQIELLHSKNHMKSARTAEQIIQSVDGANLDLDKLTEVVNQEIPELMAVNQADLARYVLSRAFVLRLMSKLLERAEDGNYALEAALHSLIFPLKTDDWTGSYFCDINHNLWLMDERYAFYDYLASDKQLRSHDVLPTSTSQERPDICGYFFSQDSVSAKADAIVIVELKRPWRTDFANEKRNPLRQVLDYIAEIKTNKALDYKGKTIPVGDNTRFYCHIICNTSASYIQEMADVAQMTQTIDGNGWFTYYEKHKAYVEISPFAKILEDAFNRNNSFFRKLGIRDRFI